MKSKSIISFLFTTALLLAACSTGPELPSAEEITTIVIDLEKEALNQWSAGLPQNYCKNMADDACYMDDIGAQNRLDGLKEIQTYLNTLEGKVGTHQFEMLNTSVQVYGNSAVLSFWYQGSVEGHQGPPWKATVVYQYMDRDWKSVHANWSLVKPPPPPEGGHDEDHNQGHGEGHDEPS